MCRILGQVVPTGPATLPGAPGVPLDPVSGPEAPAPPAGPDRLVPSAALVGPVAVGRLDGSERRARSGSPVRPVGSDGG
ncbi:hypothetical protein Sme01_65370 [Sphaerisporangium melleum]|uniref:Uncharacterized protein n=1 Tax=Sphaerisporangium melleum TaxID=321316 RepID=A0A917RF67_9ACTN|nr:hypothetical protein GCM10007964_51930 [Sphaerisporangium melleum]GII74061.1 hypothetical protein Sme01_65370 [Sphaerisporangium melleum]